MPVTVCDDGSYCCGNTDLAKQCCYSHEGYVLINGDAVLAGSVNASASGTTSASSTFTGIVSFSSSATSTSTSGTASPSQQTQTAPKTNTAAIAGGVVTGVLGIVLIAVGTWLFFKRWKNTMANKSGSHGSPRIAEFSAQTERHELPDPQKPLEVMVEPEPRELAA